MFVEVTRLFTVVLLTAAGFMIGKDLAPNSAELSGICGMLGCLVGYLTGGVLGRFLEHSRVFRFGSEKRGMDFYLGSADMMDRNLDRRVEAVVPVVDPELCTRLDEMLSLTLSDDVLAWELGPDGCWSKVHTKKGIDSQVALQQLAIERTNGKHG